MTQCLERFLWHLCSQFPLWPERRVQRFILLECSQVSPTIGGMQASTLAKKLCSLALNPALLFFQKSGTNYIYEECDNRNKVVDMSMDEAKNLTAVFYNKRHAADKMNLICTH